MSLSKNIKLIILDRDGVINHDSDNYIKSAGEWIPISGSLEAIAKLNNTGYKVAIATNQSGIARGYYTIKILDKMHQKMQSLLSEIGGTIDYIAYCPHGPDDNCSCRKPKPRMLLNIAEKFSIKTENIIFIGDTITDMQAANAANIGFVLVKTGKGTKTLNKIIKLNNKGTNESFSVHNSLQDFVNIEIVNAQK